jgi:hypothetical protein
MTIAAFPPVADAISTLAQITGVPGLGPDTALIDIDVDSVDFIEWLDELGLDVELDHATLYDLLEDGTVGDLCAAVAAQVAVVDQT